MSETTDPLDGLLLVLEAAGKLKELRRAGWVRMGIPDPESVADHSYRVAILALLVAPRLGLDPDKSARLALLHDLPEARVGDLTPVDGVSLPGKRAQEAAALATIVAGLPEGPALEALWHEYEEATSPEARLVRQLDKLEMALQALEYERKLEKPLDEFWISARAALSEPRLIEAFHRLAAMRPRG